MTPPARLSTTTCSIAIVTVMLLAAPPRALAAPTTTPTSEAALVRAYLATAPVKAGEAAAREHRRAAAVIAPYLNPPELSVAREQSLGDDTAFASTIVGLAISLEVSGRHGLTQSAARLDGEALSHARESNRRAAVCALLRQARQAHAVQRKVALLTEGHAQLISLGGDLQRLVKAGERAPFDHLRLTLMLEEHARELGAARGDLAGLRAELSSLTGAEVGPVTLSSVSSPRPAASTTGPSAAERALQVGARAEGLRVKAAGRARVPELGLYGGYRLDQAPGADAGHGYEAGLTINLPFTDMARRDRASAAARQRSLRARATTLEATRRARLTALVARASAISQQLRQESVDLAALRKAATRRYLTGEGDLSDLIDTLQALETASLQRDALRAELDMLALEAACARGKFHDPAMEKMVQEVN